MKWAVYWDNPLADATECLFYKTREAAMDKIDELIAAQEQASTDNERNEFWDITLLEVKGEVQQIPFGMESRLVTK